MKQPDQAAPKEQGCGGIQQTGESAGIDQLHIVKSRGVHPVQLLESGYALPGFRPSNRYALSYLESGRPESYSQYGRSTVIGQGDLVLIDMQSPFSHKAEAHHSGTTLFFLLDATLVESVLPEAGNFAARRISGQAGWGKFLSTYLARLTPVELMQLSVDPDLCAILPQQIVSLLGNAIAASKSDHVDGFRLRDHRGEELRSETLKWLHENFADQDITINRLATELHVSRRQLHRAFSRQCNELTLLKTLHRIRLEEAARLLSDRSHFNVSVHEIGRRCGFPSEATFYRLFLNAFGISPSKYRNSLLAPASAGEQVA